MKTFLLVAALSACSPGKPSEADLDLANPVRPLPAALLGHDLALADLPHPPEPERARLGRWLYFDQRISADGSISCATCHVPKHGFSETTPVSIGIRGQKGTRKAPSFINAAFAFYPETFWDGRASSLEDQAVGPMANAIEMGNSHEVVVSTITGIVGYRPFFKRAFGDEQASLPRIASAIADYERTRISGNSPVDRWLDDQGEDLVSAQVKRGHELFFGDAKCATCHVGSSFTDSRFHNLGMGWDEAAGKMKDVGRYEVSKKQEDMGAFKTPGLREVALHPPFMHDGSLATLRDVVEHYRKGGTANPWLSPKMFKLEISDADAEALVAFMEALNGEGYLDEPPALFPQ